jgi:hypothetical protein
MKIDWAFVGVVWLVAGAAAIMGMAVLAVIH